MPQLPEYAPQQIESSDKYNVQVDPQAPSLESYGGGKSTDRFEQNIGGLNETIQKIVSAEQKRADLAVGLDAEAKLFQVKNDLTFHKEYGALAQKGEKVLRQDFIKSYNDQFDERAQEIFLNLKNDNQKQAFSVFRAREKEAFLNQVNRHLMSEAEQFSQKSFQSKVDLAIEQAGLSANDPKRISQLNADLSKTIIEYGKSNGLGDAWIADVATNKVSALHSGVIENLIAGEDDIGAKKYYDAVRSEGLLTGSDDTKMKKLVEASSSRGTGLRIARHLQMQFPGDYKKQNAALETIKDPKVYEHAQTYIRSMQAANERADAQENEQNFLKAVSTGQQFGRQSVPVDLLGKLTPQYKDAFDKLMYKKEQNIPEGTDYNVYEKLMDLATQEPATFANAPIGHYFGDLSESDRKHFMALKQSIANKEDRAEDSLASYNLSKSIVEETLGNAGYDVRAKPNSTTGKIITEFKREFRERLDDFQKNVKHGRASELEQQQLADQLGKKLKTPGVLWGTNEKAGFEIKIGQVPSKDKQEIINSLKARGIQPTDDLILRYYRRGLPNASKY